MIANTIAKLIEGLDTFDVTKPICIDCETTSFDNDVEAFKPYLGHRVTIIIIGQYGKEIMSIPLRHRVEGAACIPDFDDAIQLLQEWALKVQILFNLNLKFDMHMMLQDGILFSNARLEDIAVLARLVFNEHQSYSLANLCKYYNVTQKADNEIKEWKKNNKGNKDYGNIPFSILFPYGEGDVVSAIELYYLLKGKLPDEVKPVWDHECDLTPILFEMECTGIHVDINFLMHKKLELTISLLSKAKEIRDKSGIGNPSSMDEVGAYFNSVGIQSTKVTDKGAQSWDKDALETIESLGQDTPHKVAKLIRDYSIHEQAESTFCTGWMKHIDPTDTIHGNVKQAGTNSGRTSSEQPNTQNIPKWLWEGILIPKGCVGIAWDLSQIEYRLFAHYANNEDVIQKYKDNPATDYHQLLADKLGIPRNPTKRINFGILYGMGKAKTTRTLRIEIIEHDSDDLREHLYGQYYDPTEDPPKVKDGNIPQDVLEVIAENILKGYHEQNPSIKKLQGQIKGLLYSRGYVKGFYGRRFYLDVDRAYVGLNRVIQGSAADLFKKKITAVYHASKHTGVKLHLQVHDAIYATCPIETANEYIAISHKVVTESSFRVPLLMDFELALYNWKNKIRINPSQDILQEVGRLCFSA